MRLPPPSVLATWPKPNYVDPVTRGNSAFIVSVVGLVLAFIVTCLRLYTRISITCSLGLDDFLIIVALLFAIAMSTIISLASEQYGWNRHMWDVPLTWLSDVSKLNLAFQILFSLASSITKLSLLWFCKRLLGTGSKGSLWWYNVLLILAMVFVSLCCAAFLFMSIFQCNPIHAYWDLKPTYHYHCVNDGAVVFSASVINIFTDFLSTVLPMPLIWNLKLPARQRIAVISIFSLGIIVNVAGSFRTVYVWKSMVVGYDTTWMGWPVLLAASIEINIGLICASAPALRPLVTFFLPRLLQTTRSYGSSDKRKSYPQKLWSSTTAKNSKRESNLIDGGMDHLKVFRTVEMDTFSESRGADEPANKPYAAPNHTRVVTPTQHFELKDSGTVITSQGSERSSTSLTRATNDSPFDDKNFV